MYRLTQSSAVVRVADNAFIPADPLNADRAAYDRWVLEGNTPAPYVAPPPVVPAVVSRFQARAAMAAAGIFGTVDTFMASLPKTDIRRLAWDDASEYDRSSTTLAAVAEMLELSEADLDALFLAASEVQA